ncbi:phosphotransferase [Phytoactinopolyspora mesophila]|uniref:phosphotransferase n=1 Tax=Phytoactinopolyspora mesophila TaxID=2650750 RepID=UPI001390A795
MRVPTTSADITNAWLGRVFPGRASTTHVAEPERIGAEYGFASQLYRVRLDSFSVVVKLWPTDSVAGSREVMVFRAFAAAPGPRVPACYHAAVDDAAQRGVLVLEDLHNVRQGDCLTRLTAPAAVLLARSVAALHATWWRDPMVVSADWLLDLEVSRRDEAWYSQRIGTVLDRFGNRLHTATRRVVDDAPRIAGHAHAELAAAAPTLLHRDLHLDNVVFDISTDEPILLDWALASRGPAVHDLAKVVFTVAEPADIDLVLDAYLNEVRRRGVDELDHATLIHHLEQALLLYAINDTYGKARWVPSTPREQQIIDTEISRVGLALEMWNRLRPGLFTRIA